LAYTKEEYKRHRERTGHRVSDADAERTVVKAFNDGEKSREDRNGKK
jgi:hypothetical protein